MTYKMAEWPITINTYQAGMLMGMLEAQGKQHGPMETIWQQLIAIKKKVDSDAGVVKTILPGGMVRLLDDQGTTIVRPAMEWELKQN